MSAQVDALLDNRILNFETTPYWQAYGLHEDPFATAVDPRMYYASPHWEEYIDLLQYLCQYNNDLLVIAGVSGSGKTTLINEFIAQVDDTMRTCYATADNRLTPAQLLDIISEGFDLSESELDGMLDEIQESDRICVLAIDNAHALPADTLRTLLHLIQQQSEDHPKLHIMLMGEPQLQMALLRIADAEGYDRDQLHNLTLEPFSLDETKSYLAHRMATAGLMGDLPLSDETIKRIYKLSEGIPGRINRIVKRTLVNEMPQPDDECRESWISTHRYKLLGGVILAALILGIASLLNWANQEDSLVASKQEAPAIAFQSETPVPDVAPAAAVQPTAPAAEQMTAPVVAEQSAPAPVQAQATTPEPVQTPTPEQAIASTTPEPARNWQQNELHAITSSVPPITKSTSAVKQEVPAPKETPAAAAMSSEPTTIAPVVAEPVIPAKATSKSAKQKTAPTPTAGRALSSDEKRLLEMSPSSYTLQLIGLSSARTARQFIAQHNLGGKVSYFRSAHNGKPLFVLVYGEYGSLQEAKTAAESLPDVVKRLRPWPRSMKIIQDAIKK